MKREGEINNKKENKEECPLCQVPSESIQLMKMKKKEKRKANMGIRKNIFWRIFALGGSLAGAGFALLGAIGALGLCCLYPVAAVLGFFGVSSIFLIAYNKIFIVVSVVLIGLSLFLFFRYGKRKNNLYQCPECGLLYKDKKWALKCQSWCRKHKSCNLQIIKQAVKNEKRNF
jgi:ABC-type lipoprotein release transport system permease subunit